MPDIDCSRCGTPSLAAALTDGVCPRCCYAAAEHAMAHRVPNRPGILQPSPTTTPTEPAPEKGVFFA